MCVSVRTKCCYYAQASSWSESPSSLFSNLFLWRVLPSCTKPYRVSSSLAQEQSDAAEAENSSIKSVEEGIFVLGHRLGRFAVGLSWPVVAWSVVLRWPRRYDRDTRDTLCSLHKRVPSTYPPVFCLTDSWWSRAQNESRLLRADHSKRATVAEQRYARLFYNLFTVIVRESTGHLEWTRLEVKNLVGISPTFLITPFLMFRFLWMLLSRQRAPMA